MRLCIIVGLAVIGAGCSDVRGANRGVEPPLMWTALSDGSQMAVGPLNPDGAGAESVVRCWPQTSGFECLAISGETLRDVRRYRSAALPKMLWAETTPAGYECQVTDYMGFGYKERVFNASGQLKEHISSNGMGNIEGSWTREYVHNYFEANGIQPETLWFNCLALARIVAPNSNAAIGTTDVTRELLDRGAAKL